MKQKIRRQLNRFSIFFFCIYPGSYPAFVLTRYTISRQIHADQSGYGNQPSQVTTHMEEVSK